MARSLQEMLKQLERNPPATLESIESCGQLAGVQLPDDYIDFLKFSNGAVGTLGTDQYIALWPVERLLEKNRAYQVAKYAPGIFIFGSNGGGEAYGFDLRHRMKIVQVPFIGMGLEEVEDLAPTFGQFITMLEGEV